MHNQKQSSINQAQAIRDSADRLDLRGEHLVAQLFRNAAWCIENKKNYFDDINIQEGLPVKRREVGVQ
jgi:hypothetical protein